MHVLLLGPEKDRKLSINKCHVTYHEKCIKHFIFKAGRHHMYVFASEVNTIYNCVNFGGGAHYRTEQSKHIISLIYTHTHF